MPPLIFHHYRFRIGSDDFFYPTLIGIIYHFFIFLTCLAAFVLQCRCLSPQLGISCSVAWFDASGVLLLLYLLIVGVFILNISSKGNIIETEKRLLMPRFLWLRLCGFFAEISFVVAGTILLYFNTTNYVDEYLSLIALIAVILDVMHVICFSACIIGEKSKHSNADRASTSPTMVTECTALFVAAASEDDNSTYLPHQSSWEERSRRCVRTARFLTFNLFGGDNIESDSFYTVAKIVSRFLSSCNDLVLSDIIAGFILLRAVQNYRDLVEDENTIKISPPNKEKLSSIPEKCMSTGDSTLEHPGTGKNVVEETVEIVFPRSSPRDDFSIYGRDMGLSVADLQYYSKYSVGIYGWMLYVWSHPYTAFGRLIFNSCSPRAENMVGDGCLHMHQTALQLTTHIQASDILYCSFTNSVCKPAFCVVLDKKKKVVIIAIRGTLSLEDCLTDALASGTSMELCGKRWGFDGKGSYAHEGILRSAEYVREELSRLRILDHIYCDHDISKKVEADTMPQLASLAEYKEYSLLVTGHSLGAGTAALLTLMLKPVYPNVRCIAYSPPGGILCGAACALTSEFILSCVVNKDVIARSSWTSLMHLRDTLLDLIIRSKVNKSTLLRHAFRPCHPDELLFPEGINNNNEFVQRLQYLQTFYKEKEMQEPHHDLLIPGAIIHFVPTCLKIDARCFFPCCRANKDCGWGSGQEYYYEPRWVRNTEFKHIDISRSMLDDHFPDKVHDVIQSVARQMGVCSD